MVCHKLRDMLISNLNLRLKKKKLQFSYLNQSEYIWRYIVIITFRGGGLAGSDQCL